MGSNPIGATNYLILFDENKLIFWLTKLFNRV